MNLPFSNLFNKNRLNTSRNNSPSQKMKVSGSGHTITQVTNNNDSPNEEELENKRRQQLISQLRQQWLLSNDGITPARMAGLEWGNGELVWLNQKLVERNETWQLEQ